MILNFTKVDKVRLSLEEYTLNTRLMVKGQKKKKNPTQNGTKQKRKRSQISTRKQRQGSSTTVGQRFFSNAFVSH